MPQKARVLQLSFVAAEVRHLGPVRAGLVGVCLARGFEILWAKGIQRGL